VTSAQAAKAAPGAAIRTVELNRLDEIFAATRMKPARGWEEGTQKGLRRWKIEWDPAPDGARLARATGLGSPGRAESR
jgi:hypothetical protein